MTTTAPTYAEGAATKKGAQTATLGILMAISASHMLNDVMQSLAPALYPVFREKMALSFFQTGIITFVFQATASLLQPFIGLVTDRRPMNALLPAGMAFTLIGLVGLAFADTYPLLLDRRGADRRRQRGLSSRSLARRAGGLGRPARLRPEPVPGRRQFWPVDRAAARRLRRRAVRAALGSCLHRLRPRRDRDPDRGQPLVRGASGEAEGRRRGSARDPAARLWSFAPLRC